MSSSEKTTDLNQIDPVPLDPIILRARDELLEKYSEKSFEEQITFYKAVIEGEKDSVARLSAMAARVYILRKRLALLAGNLMEDQLDDLSNKQSGFDLDNSLTETSDIQDPEIKDNLRELTQKAFNEDIFGAPTFVVNNKIFWGQDRLEYALDEYNS